MARSALARTSPGSHRTWSRYINAPATSPSAAIRSSVSIVPQSRQGFGLDLRPLIQFGASPRATLALARASRANAFLDGRAYVTPDDVKLLAPDVFRHRILLTYEAEAEELKLLAKAGGSDRCGNGMCQADREEIRI